MIHTTHIWSIQHMPNPYYVCLLHTTQVWSILHTSDQYRTSLIHTSHIWSILHMPIPYSTCLLGAKYSSPCELPAPMQYSFNLKLTHNIIYSCLIFTLETLELLFKELRKERVESPPRPRRRGVGVFCLWLIGVCRGFTQWCFLNPNLSLSDGSGAESHSN